MILIDYHQITIANYCILRISKERDEIEVDMVKEMLIRSICKCRREWSDEFGQIILCDDARNNWRELEFKYYKGNREKNKYPFEILNKAKILAAKQLNVPILMVDNAEADDVIAIVSREYASRKEPVLIYSRDKDFKQLHNEYIKQYSSIAKDWITVEDAELFLKEMILTGDAGDGIPNVLSDDDVLVCEDKKQERLTKKKKEMFGGIIPDKYNKNYWRNMKLICFDYIPDVLAENILTKLERVDKFFEVMEKKKEK